MPDKKKCKAVVKKQEQLADGIYSMWVEFPNDADASQTAKPGQFASLYSKDGSRILPRPISICEIDKKKHILRFVYRVVGKGTTEFSKYEPGDTIDIIAPLGNGFPVGDESQTSILLGGGIGIPPMLELAKQLPGKVDVVLGYRDSNMFLKEEFEPYANVYVATEDGSAGTKGNVIHAIIENTLQADVIYACGPIPMLRGVKEYAVQNGTKAYISMEEKMACGIGACLGCVCQSKEKDSHSHVNNKRVCKDGPVFEAQDIEL